MPLIFVYGSLKAGFCNAHLNQGTRQAGEFRTRERMGLYLLGDGRVPCLVLAHNTDDDDARQVHGEVYEVDADALATMDRLERLGEANGYLRVAIEVESTDPQTANVVPALAYVKTPEQIAGETARVGPFNEYTAEHADGFRW